MNEMPANAWERRDDSWVGYVQLPVPVPVSEQQIMTFSSAHEVPGRSHRFATRKPEDLTGTGVLRCPASDGTSK